MSSRLVAFLWNQAANGDKKKGGGLCRLRARSGMALEAAIVDVPTWAGLLPQDSGDAEGKEGRKAEEKKTNSPRL